MLDNKYDITRSVDKKCVHQQWHVLFEPGSVDRVVDVLLQIQRASSGSLQNKNNLVDANMRQTNILSLHGNYQIHSRVQCPEDNTQAY